MWVGLKSLTVSESANCLEGIRGNYLKGQGLKLFRSKILKTVKYGDAFVGYYKIQNNGLPSMPRKCKKIAWKPLRLQCPAKIG